MAYPVMQSDPTAVFGRRVLAAVVDVILVSSLLVLMWQSQAVYEPLPDGLDVGTACETIKNDTGANQCFEIAGWRAYYIEDQGVSNAISLASFLGSFTIFVILQGLTGWTPGKLLTGIRTVQADGSIVGIPKAFVRWILLIVDGQPCGVPLVGFITGLTTQGHRRVGDMAAKTFVVAKSAVGSPILVPGMATSAAPPAPPSAAWGTPAPPEGGWGTLVPPASPAAPTAPAPTAPAAAAPQWDEARGTYIQWDPARSAWLQWDEPSKQWVPIPGQ